MPLSALGPRVLLRRLREVMAEPETAQKRLDKIVSLIAANMVAEVCSIYVMRPGNVLELYATEGLKREAVHKSKLKVGEGLVGLIADQAIGLNLSDADKHDVLGLWRNLLAELTKVNLARLVRAVLAPHDRVHRQLAAGRTPIQNCSNPFVLIGFEP